MLYNYRKHYKVEVLLLYNRKCGECMKAKGHLDKAQKIKGSIELLRGSDENVEAIVEICYGFAHHLIAYGLEEKYGEHKDTHQGVPSLLRQYKQNDIAIHFERLDTLRIGRWYGGKGNGEVQKEALKIVGEIEKWAIE